jgi:hypothetical protein
MTRAKPPMPRRPHDTSLRFAVETSEDAEASSLSHGYDESAMRRAASVVGALEPAWSNSRRLRAAAAQDVAQQWRFRMLAVVALPSSLKALRMATGVGPAAILPRGLSGDQRRSPDMSGGGRAVGG